MPRPDGNFWFAEYDADQGNDRYRWRPILQMDGMTMSTEGPWFATERACEEFIRDEILGARTEFEAISNVGVIPGEIVPPPQEVARLFAEANDRPGHMGPA